MAAGTCYGRGETLLARRVESVGTREEVILRIQALAVRASVGLVLFVVSMAFSGFGQASELLDLLKKKGVITEQEYKELK
ncbi:MAG: hypothetical protein ACE5JS_11570, partial [Nitrospinota bacterium]